MERDIRNSPEFHAVTAFYTALFRPGQERVYAAPEAVPSADGKTAYFTGLCFKGSLTDGPSTGVYRIDLEARTFEPICDGVARMPRPSPNGAHIAFVARPKGGPGEQLHIASADGQETYHTFDPQGTIEQVEWSADGASLLIIVAGLGADLAGYQGGYATPVEFACDVDWLPTVRTDRAENLWRRLWIVDIASKARRIASLPGTNVWEASWCGLDRIAAIRSSDHGEGSWYSSSLVLIDAANGQERLLYQPSDQIGLPTGSRDGRKIAFVEAVCSDRGIVCGTLKLADVATSRIETLKTNGVEITSSLPGVTISPCIFQGSARSRPSLATIRSSGTAPAKSGARRR